MPRSATSSGSPPLPRSRRPRGEARRRRHRSSRSVTPRSAKMTGASRATCRNRCSRRRIPGRCPTNVDEEKSRRRARTGREQERCRSIRREEEDEDGMAPRRPGVCETLCRSRRSRARGPERPTLGRSLCSLAGRYWEISPAVGAVAAVLIADRVCPLDTAGKHAGRHFPSDHADSRPHPLPSPSPPQSSPGSVPGASLPEASDLTGRRSRPPRRSERRRDVIPVFTRLWHDGSTRSRRQGLGLTLAALFVLGAGVVLGLLAYLVRTNSTLASIDNGVAKWGHRNASPFSTHGLNAVTQLGSITVVIGLAVLLVVVELVRLPNRWLVPFVIAVIAGEEILATLIKNLVDPDAPRVQSRRLRRSGRRSRAASTRRRRPRLLGRCCSASRPSQAAPRTRAVLAGAAVGIAVACIASSRVAARSPLG